jgi:multiple sugar transport system ATP-binding protein
MNFFRGTLSQDGSHLVQGDAALMLGNLARVQPALEDGLGREIVLGLRPEDLQLATDDAGRQIAGPGFSARLEYIEPVGNEVFLNLRFADRDLVARMPPRPLPGPGSTVRMSFAPARLHCFDAQSGARIVASAASHGAASALNASASAP